MTTAPTLTLTRIKALINDGEKIAKFVLIISPRFTDSAVDIDAAFDDELTGAIVNGDRDWVRRMGRDFERDILEAERNFNAGSDRSRAGLLDVYREVFDVHCIDILDIT